MNRPPGLLDIGGGGLTRLRDDFLQVELARNYHSETEFGAMETNRWGMRDQDYTLLPPSGTVRGLLLGFSTVLGWGVAHEETFESVLETRINQSLAESNARAKFELLNLSVPGYRPPQQVMALDEALKFAPRLVFYTASEREQWTTINFLADILKKGVEIPYPDLKALIDEAGIKPNMDDSTILKQLKLHDEALLQWVYGYIARRCSEIGARPVWIFLPSLFPPASIAEDRRARELAQAAGFEIIDLTGLFDGEDPYALSLKQWDRHPNATAHKLIASRIYMAIRSNPHAYGLPPF